MRPADEAEGMYKRAMAGKEKALGRDHTSTIRMVNSLELLYADQRRMNKAEKLYQHALASSEQAFGSDHTSTLSAVNNR